MNYTRNTSRLSFSNEQFFRGTNAFTPYVLLAMGVVGFLLPLFMDTAYWMVFAKAGFILWPAVLYVGYTMRKEAYALVIEPNDIIVQRGYLLPSTRIRAFGETEIDLTLSGSKVTGILYQYPSVDADRYNEKVINDHRLSEYLTATKMVSVSFLNLQQWKSLSDETGLPLTIEHSHPDIEQSSLDEQDSFEIYAPNEETFEKEVFNNILDFLHGSGELQFLGKTEVYNAKEPLNEEDIYHEFLWKEGVHTYSLSACIDCIEFTCNKGQLPKMIKDLCSTFSLKVDEE